MTFGKSILNRIFDRDRPLRNALAGSALGVVFEFPTLFAAVLSGGAGHGHYMAARALFPLPMLFSRLEGEIGVVSILLTLFQFPMYGAMIGWVFSCTSKKKLLLLPAAVHLAALIACFSGALPDFS
jgi:hypothetical protein